MKEFVEYIVKALVNNPEAVSVTEEETDASVTIKVMVAESDMGKVIGRGGKIANAIRTLVRTSGRDQSKKINVQFGEDK